MPRFGPTSRRELINNLRELGFVGPLPGTRHEVMLKGTHKLRIPNPHRGDIGAELLGRVLRQAGVSREEWEQL